MLFKPSKAYMKSVCQPLPQTMIPGMSTSGGATPMPDRTSSLTPAWDPLSHTPQYSQLLIPKSFKTYCLQKIYRTMDPSSLTPAWNPHEEPLATNS